MKHARSRWLGDYCIGAYCISAYCISALCVGVWRRPIASVIALVIAASCGSEPLALVSAVRADAQLASQVALVEMTVLASPAECSALSPSPLVLQDSLDVVATAALTPGGSQTFHALKSGAYLLVAEAYDTAGTRIARGCVTTTVGKTREVTRAVVALSSL